MDTVNKVMELSPNIALVILVVIGITVILLIKNAKKIKAFGDGFYNTKKKNDEYKKMLLNADKKVGEHEQTIKEQDSIIQKLKGEVSDLQKKLEDYEKANEEHWGVSVEYRNQYDELKRQDSQRYDGCMETQQKLADAVMMLTQHGDSRDKKIDALVLANKELLGDKINQRYNKYIALKGIPADELDEFTNIHACYKKLGGNSVGDAKYNYVIEHLPVIPVETKLVINSEH